MGEDEETFLLTQSLRGMESEEHVVFSFCWEQCAVTEVEPSALDEKEAFQPTW